MRNAKRILAAPESARFREPVPPRQVPGSRSRAADFDAIVLHCLAAEADGRYQAVSDVSGDLRRFAAGLAVGAHHGGWPYRARKWIGRYRLTFPRHAYRVGVCCIVGRGAISSATVGAARQQDRARQFGCPAKIAGLTRPEFTSGNQTEDDRRRSSDHA